MKTVTACIVLLALIATGCPPHQSAAPRFHPAANPAAVP
jgi:hypothetical protein